MSQSGNFTNLIPNEISSETRFNKFFTMKNLILVLGTFTVLNTFNSIPHPSLSLFYLIFCGVFSLSLIVPSSQNDGMLLFQTIRLSLRKQTSILRSIEILEVDDE